MLKDLYGMSVPPKVAAKVLMSEQTSNTFRSLRMPEKPVEAAEASIVGTTGNESSECVMEAVEAPSVSDYLSIDDLKVSELKEILDSKDIEYTATRKADLIKIVKENS